jgi:methenyltetrahydrofolate cyclohydrolase
VTPSPGDALEGYLDIPLGRYLDELAQGRAAPGGGSAAALAVALGACLCAMAARLSARQLPGDEAYAMETKAERLRAGAASLIQADAHSYLGVIKAQRRAAAGTHASQGAPARTGPGADTHHRQRAVAGALSAAADVPMQVLEAGAEVAGLAARLAADGNPNLRGDAVAAALLAEAGVRAATELVTINLAGVPGDERPARARRLLRQTARSARAAQQPTDPGS